MEQFLTNVISDEIQKTGLQIAYSQREIIKTASYENEFEKIFGMGRKKRIEKNRRSLFIRTGSEFSQC